MADVYDQLTDALYAFQRELEDFIRLGNQQQDLSLLTLMVIGFVDKEPGITVSELSRRVGLSKSHASELIEGLARGGVVTKQADPGDKRRLQLSVTEHGRALFAEQLTLARTRFIERITALSPEVAGRLTADLRALSSVLAHTRSHGSPKEEPVL